MFIGLTGEDSGQLPKIQQFITSSEIPWPNGYGASSTLMALGVRYFPTTIVVDTHGRIAWRDDMGGSLDEAIDAALVP